MTITYQTPGATVAGTTSLAVPYPASPAAGDLFILHVTNKYPTNGPSTPADFTLIEQLGAGSGAAGVDSGQIYSTVYYKVATGSETGNLTVTVTSANSSSARMYRLSNGTGAWGVVSSSGSDTTTGTAWSITTSGTIVQATDDFVMALSAVNGNTGTYSAHALSSSGITFGTVSERTDLSVTNGDDHRMLCATATITAGSGTQTVTYTATAASNAANGNCGPTIVVRLRQDPLIVALTGVAGTGAAGDITVSGKANVPLTGVAGTGEVGTLVAVGDPDPTNMVDGPLGGQAMGIVAQGTDSKPSGDVTVVLTGVAGTGAAGDITVSGKANVQITGVAGTGAVGDVTVSGKANVPITGVAGTGEVGTVTVSAAANVPIMGVAGTGAAGDITVSGDANVLLVGVAGLGEVGEVIATGEINVAVPVVGGAGQPVEPYRRRREVQRARDDKAIPTPPKPRKRGTLHLPPRPLVQLPTGEYVTPEVLAAWLAIEQDDEEVLLLTT